MRYWDLGLIAGSAVLLMGWILGRISKDLPRQIRTLNSLRLFLALLPLSAYTGVFFLYELSLLFGKPIRPSTGRLILLISAQGLALFFLICAVFVGLTLFHSLWRRIEEALRSRQLRDNAGALLHIQLSMGQSKAGLLANVILLALMPVPLILLRFERKLVAYFPAEVDAQLGTLLYILALLMLATALYGLRRHYVLWIRERELYLQVASGLADPRP